MKHYFVLRRLFIKWIYGLPTLQESNIKKSLGIATRYIFRENFFYIFESILTIFEADFEATGVLAKIGSSLKSKYHNQV